MSIEVILYNNITYSLAYIILLSTLIKSKKWKYAAAFIIITIVGIPLTIPAPFLIMPTNAIVLSLLFLKECRDFRQTFYKCLTVGLLLWGGIVATSSPVILFAYDWYVTDGFNYYAGGVLLAVTVVIKAKIDIMEVFLYLAHEKYAIALTIIMVFFLSIVLPLIYYPTGPENARQWNMYALSIAFLLAVVVLIFNRMMKLEKRGRELEALIEYNEAYRRQTLDQFEKVITIKHFYTTLYHSLAPFIIENNMDGLRCYFEKYITPIHKESILNSNQVTDIKNELIRNFLIVIAGQTATMDNITLETDVSGNIQIPEDIEKDVFEILCNLVDNALYELAEQENGLLRIWLRKIDNELIISIANTLTNDVDIAQLYINNRKKGHGYGLKRIRAICQNTGMEHFTYKNGTYEGKNIFIQQISIDLQRRLYSVR